jgi:GntR family transcriptional regulator, carbon starvation induced regulator
MSSSSSSVRRATLSEQIEDALRRDIIEGTFTPGQRLTAAELTVHYQVSATPLREALQRLAAQGMVDIDPRLGATVPPISRDHLRDTYAVREMLEVAATMRSIERADRAWADRLGKLFAEFEEAVAEGDRDAGVLSWSAAHRAFHEGLMANCDSPWLTSLLNIITDHSERYRMLSARMGERDPIGEHAAIYKAAIALDAVGAAAAVKQHLQRTVEVVERALPVSDGSTGSKESLGADGGTADLISGPRLLSG